MEDGPKGLRWMLQADAPLLVNPRPTLHKIGWMAEFLSNIPRYKANTVETVRLAIAARAVLFEMAAREGIDFDLERRGILHFYDRQKTSRMRGWSTASSPRAAGRPSWRRTISSGRSSPHCKAISSAAS